MWIQKRAITARGLVRVPSLPHRALVLSNPTRNPTRAPPCAHTPLPAYAGRGLEICDPGLPEP